MMRKREMGFSYLVSPGNELAVTFEDYLEWLIEDPDTSVVGAYLETVRHPERLRELGARAEETGTSIIVMKVGRTPFAQEASAAHTAALASDDAVVDALFRQSGMVRVDGLNELAEAISIRLSPRFHRAGRRLLVLSGSGGECSHVSDVAISEGFEMEPLAETTKDGLSGVLPDFTVRRNPLDGGGAGLYEDPAVLPAMLDVVLADPKFETLAVTLGLDSRDWMVQALADSVSPTDRFVLAYNSMTTGAVEAAMVGKLRDAGIPYVESTETTFAALAKLLRRTAPSRDPRTATRWTQRSGPTRNLDLGEARDLLAEVGIAMPAMRQARSESVALDFAAAVGAPVALKIDQPDIAHRTDVGGVRLGLLDPVEVARHYRELRALLDAVEGAENRGSIVVQEMAPKGIELILGLRFDPVVGPAVLIGMGGVLAELLDDVAVVAPPFTRADADAALRTLRGARMFAGVRGAAPVPTTAVVNAMVALGDWALDRADGVSVVEMNPLVVSDDGSVLAVDALVSVIDHPGGRS
jgi:acetyltransferase